VAHYLQLIKAFRSALKFVISFFQEGSAATKCQHDLTKILSKSFLDIWMISQPRRVNLGLWIRPFDFLKAAFFGHTV
jgi:hypothetical protein